MSDLSDFGQSSVYRGEAVKIPEANFYPPFNITRVSHTVLGVSDLKASKNFYTKVIGLVVSEELDDALYLRGIEEVCHHSLVLRKGATDCRNIGLRVLTEQELDKAEQYFRSVGLASAWTTTHGQGRTLQVRDPFGLPLELCARMTPLPRKALDFNEHQGGAALRFDHYQLHMPDVAATWSFYSSLGFRTSDYILSRDDRPTAVFLHRKDNPWDLVIMENHGPRLHHLAYIVAGVQEMYRACDLAGQYGYGRQVERGPGTHAGGHGRYVYFRDPDGHRIELLLEAPHYMTDAENEPVQMIPTKGTDWGLPAQRAWFEEATLFASVTPAAPGIAPTPLTLEKYLFAANANGFSGTPA